MGRVACRAALAQNDIASFQFNHSQWVDGLKLAWAEAFPIVGHEEADSRDAGGSGGEAGGGPFGGDSAEGEDWDGFSGFGGGVEGVESAAWEQVFAGEGFFEDGRIEDESVAGGGVGVPLGFFFCAENLVDGVAGMADDGVASGSREKVAGCGGRGWRGGRGKVDSISSGAEGDLCFDEGGAAEEDAGGLVFGADNCDDLLCEVAELGWVEVFLTDLNVVDVVLRPGAGDRDEGCALLGFSSCKLVAVGDGVKQHRV